MIWPVDEPGSLEAHIHAVEIARGQRDTEAQALEESRKRREIAEQDYRSHTERWAAACNRFEKARKAYNDAIRSEAERVANEEARAGARAAAPV